MAKVFTDESEGEFEIQAILYMGLVSMGYRVRGEVPSTVIFPDIKMDRNSRFDLVVFDNKWRPLEIIEAKQPNYSIPFSWSQQHRRYARYGLPLRFAKSMKTAFELLEYYQKERDRYEMAFGLSEYSARVVNFMDLLTFE